MRFIRRLWETLYWHANWRDRNLYRTTDDLYRVFLPAERADEMKEWFSATLPENHWRMDYRGGHPVVFSFKHKSHMAMFRLAFHGKAIKYHTLPRPMVIVNFICFRPVILTYAVALVFFFHVLPFLL